MNEQTRYPLGDFLGYDVLTMPSFVYGAQPTPGLYQRFDGEGRLVESRPIPPAVRIDYSGTTDAERTGP